MQTAPLRNAGNTSDLINQSLPNAWLGCWDAVSSGTGTLTTEQAIEFVDFFRVFLQGIAAEIVSQASAEAVSYVSETLYLKDRQYQPQPTRKLAA